MISVGLLGAGYISDSHLSALRKIPGIQVKAICDLDRSRAKQFAKDNGIANFYSDLAQMLSQEVLDVVHILTPPHIHYVNGLQVIEAGVNAFFEKPLCHTVEYCKLLQKVAQEKGVKIGVSHNFLFTPPYEKLLADIRAGHLGRIDQIDIVWNKELGLLQGGPYGVWMLQTPQNILFEVAPHACMYVVNLLGGLPDSLTVDVHDRIDLPQGLTFYRCWEIRGWKGKTSIRIRLSFINGYPEHYIHVRGTKAASHVDQEHDIYHRFEHTPQMSDIDRYLNALTLSRNAFVQANGTLFNFIASKLKLGGQGGPFPRSILRSMTQFYNGLDGSIDDRIHSQNAQLGIELAEWIARLMPKLELKLIPDVAPTVNVVSSVSTSVLVIGGTGFIGKALIQKLCEQGHRVRVLTRDPRKCADEFRNLNVDIIRGDLTNSESVRQSLERIHTVYHLARGSGKTWSSYIESDVEPTQELANLCLEQSSVKRLIYTSSIAIYNAGDRRATITEKTESDAGMARIAPYTRSKVENEKRLMTLYHQKGLPVVIFRPGIVLGCGGSPYHWGIVGWPYTSICQLWGKGNNPLPIVLLDDVVDALVRAIEVPGIEGESFNLAAQPCITANQYLDEFERSAHIKIRRVSISAPKFYVEALLKWGIKVAGRDPDAAFPSYADVKGRSLASMFDCSKAEHILGWSPISDRAILIKEGIHLPVRQFFRLIDDS